MMGNRAAAWCEQRRYQEQRRERTTPHPPPVGIASYPRHVYSRRPRIANSDLTTRANEGGSYAPPGMAPTMRSPATRRLQRSDDDSHAAGLLVRARRQAVGQHDDGPEAQTGSVAPPARRRQRVTGGCSFYQEGTSRGLRLRRCMHMGPGNSRRQCDRPSNQQRRSGSLVSEEHRSVRTSARRSSRRSSAYASPRTVAAQAAELWLRRIARSTDSGVRGTRSSTTIGSSSLTSKSHATTFAR